jgi:hypothetical protein
MTTTSISRLISSGAGRTATGFVDGDEAFVTYLCVAKGHKNGGKSFRNTEFFVFDGDKVKRIDVYFGAAYENGVFVRPRET